MQDSSGPAPSGARKLADRYHANFSCFSPPRVTIRYARPCCFCVTLLLLWLGPCSSVLSYLIPCFIQTWWNLHSSDSTPNFALLPAIFILSRDCHKLLPVLSCLSFPLQKQIMLQQKNVLPQFEDQLPVIKGITVVTRQLPMPRFSSPSLISKAFKHMFTCRLMIISLRLSRAMLFCLWFMDPYRLMNYFWEGLKGT